VVGSESGKGVVMLKRWLIHRMAQAVQYNPPEPTGNIVVDNLVLHVKLPRAWWWRCTPLRLKKAVFMHVIIEEIEAEESGDASA
jgi:hypothetical protein